MRKLSGLVLGVAVAALAACGDNSNDCGPGTHAEDGLCIPDDGTTPPNCGDGTRLDEATNTCVIDPDSCQSGTVLIDGDCVDPTEGLTVDVTEGAEPNALGIGGEDSDEPAGVFELKPVGATTVVQGVLKPRADTNDDSVDEPDFDTYIFEVNGPSLVEISVDGTAGVQGAFGLIGDPSEALLGNYSRYAFNLTGDTSKRQLYLPQGGFYLLAVADTRSWKESVPAGGDDGKYFVSIAQKALPTPTTMTVTDGVGQANGSLVDGEVDFYSVQTGSGLSRAFIESFDPTFTAQGELIVMAGNELRGIVTDDVQLEPSLTFTGNTAGTTLLVIDQPQNNSITDAPYRVRLQTSTATRADLLGGNTTATNPGTTVSSPFGVNQLAYFSFDINATDQIVGLDLAFNVPVSGDIYDPNGVRVVTFTSLAAGTRINGYKGLARLRGAGRYYIGVYAPGGAVGSSIQLTSTITPLTPAQLVFDTAVNDAAPNAFNSVPYRYSINAEPWQQYKLAADAATGGARVRVLPLATTYGRLDSLTTVNATNVPTTVAGPAGTFSVTAAAAGDNFVPWIVPGFPSPQLLLVNTVAGAGTFDLEVDKRTYTDLGDHVAPYTGTEVDQAAEDFFDGDTHRYFIKSTPGNFVTVTITPDVALDAGVRWLDYDEFDLDDVDVGLEGDDEILEGIVNDDGYFAFDVYGFSAGTFDLAIDIEAPPAPPTPFYSVTTGATPYQNLCANPGATDVTPANRDDGLTGIVTAPTGFQLYGTNAPELKISTNGFITFNTATTTATYWSGQAIPSTRMPTLSFAPMFGDLIEARICTQTVGNKLYIQWRGYDYYADLIGYSPDTAFLAILDGDTDTLEVVFPSWYNWALGATGVQQSSTVGQEVTIEETPAGKSFLFTPNPV